MDYGDAAYWDCGGDPTQSEIERYNELKRLAEIAWAAILPVSGTPGEHIIAGWAWNAAEAMHAESEKRRPK